ncbi:MAG: hypothetical protein BWY27_01441 [Bacteroidetes bacterium ADurb.Bin234]|nr:MAG: hypothetical protein BWY27_01441 [Bacteroidetes bacterium ADurb.Bin234]
MYKTLGIKWLHEAFCPALAFVSADSDEARNPQRFIHVTVMHHNKKTPALTNADKNYKIFKPTISLSD